MTAVLVGLLLLASTATAQVSVLDLFKYPSCSICPNAQILTDPSAVLAEKTAGIITERSTCAEVEQRAIEGDFSPAACVLLSQQISNVCGCMEEGMTIEPTAVPPSGAATPAPTDMPVSEPTTDAPTPAVTTAAPVGDPVTEAPVPTATEPPTTEAPVATPTASAGNPVGGDIILRMALSTNDPASSAVETLEKACGTFLNGEITSATDIACKYMGVAAERRLRVLQESSDVDLEMEVTGKSTLTSEAFEALVIRNFNSAPGKFIAALEAESATDAESQVVFKDATSVSAFRPGEGSSPTSTPKAAPSESSDDGLSGGAVFGIIVAVIAAVGVIVAIFYSTSKGEDDDVPATREVKEAQETEIKVPRGEPDASSYKYSLEAGQVGSSTKSGDAGSGNEISSHALSSLRQNMISRTVQAPPGKLGIVIDTTLEGPVVHKVNPQSPLEGMVHPGDIIIAIDDVDTRAMSASAITALMVRTANLRRKLTVLSEDVTS